MALMITDECISCGACEPECPTESITEGDIYVIAADTCNECSDQDDGPACVDVCPVDCIELLEKDIEIDSNECTDCKLCIYVCPIEVISYVEHETV